MPNRRRPSSSYATSAFRYAILNRDGWVCQKCGCPLSDTTIRDRDYGVTGHRIAWAEGGRLTWENCQAECRWCNQSEGATIRSRVRATKIERLEAELAAVRLELARCRGW